MGRQVSKRFKKEKAKAAAKRRKGEAATKWQHALTAAIGVCEWDDADGGELIGALVQLPDGSQDALVAGRGGGGHGAGGGSHNALPRKQRCRGGPQLEKL